MGVQTLIHQHAYMYTCMYLYIYIYIQDFFCPQLSVLSFTREFFLRRPAHSFIWKMTLEELGKRQ